MVGFKTGGVDNKISALGAKLFELLGTSTNLPKKLKADLEEDLENIAELEDHLFELKYDRPRALHAHHDVTLDAKENITTLYQHMESIYRLRYHTSSEGRLLAQMS
jgi:hypothetical protein